MARWMLALLLGLFLVSCAGEEGSGPGPAAGGSGTVVLRHTVLRGIPGPVDVLRVSGFDAAGTLVYGPIEAREATEITLTGVPVSVTRLRVEYVDVDTGRVVGVHEESVRITAGGVVVIDEPVISLLVPYTTLDVTIQPTAPNAKGYVKLTHGAGEPSVVRTDLGASAQDGRQNRRSALACIAQISDVHVIDAESTLRVEYLRGQPPDGIVSVQDFQGAFRAQETLTTHVGDSMVRQLNALQQGPISGRAYDCLVSTGDNGDNRQGNEVTWFMTLLDGGTLSPSSGNPALYEGVQDTTANPLFNTYYHPDANVDDIYKSVYGFPDYPGLLSAAVKPFPTEGSKTRWFTVYGNHDNLILGNLPTRADVPPQQALDTILAGTQKNLDLPVFYNGTVVGFLIDFFNLFGFWNQFIPRLEAASTPHRIVTADPTRKTVTAQQWAQAHFNSPSVPGPVGHGLAADSPTTGNLYYAFSIAPRVVGITMDTVNRAGYADGSLDPTQFAWIEQQLIANSSRYYDSNGSLITTNNPDSLIVLFSHHNSQTMNNPLTDADNPATRVLGSQLLALIQRFPNVVMWVNGHSHVCRIYAHPDASGKTGGFWEVNTPSHIDYPQQSRIIEVMNNADGTLSFFATLVDHQAPPETDPSKLDPQGLASISRELSANDFELPRPGQIGTPGDRNVELLIKAPFGL